MAQSTRRRRELVQHGEEEWNAHRGDFETCPHCGHVMPARRWERAAHMLCLQPRLYKKGCASILSECPKCFEMSWVHIALDDIDEFRSRPGFPKAWIRAAKKESAAQKLAALREWGASLCWQCSQLESGTVTHHAYRTCQAGMGPARIECSTFKALETTPRDIQP